MWSKCEECQLSDGVHLGAEDCKGCKGQIHHWHCCHCMLKSDRAIRTHNAGIACMHDKTPCHHTPEMRSKCILSAPHTLLNKQDLSQDPRYAMECHLSATLFWLFCMAVVLCCQLYVLSPPHDVSVPLYKPSMLSLAHNVALI